MHDTPQTSQVYDRASRSLSIEGTTTISSSIVIGSTASNRTQSAKRHAYIREEGEEKVPAYSFYF